MGSFCRDSITDNYRTERGSAGSNSTYTPADEFDPALPRSVLYDARALIECAAMTISFSDRVTIPDDVLISHLQEESVILNLDSESYFGLDDVGTRFLSVLTSSESIEAAYERLRNEYDVDPQVLRNDLLALVENLIDQGLLIREIRG